MPSSQRSASATQSPIRIPNTLAHRAGRRRARQAVAALCGNETWAYARPPNPSLARTHADQGRGATVMTAMGCQSIR
jgi:hypothetical protein